MVQRVSETRHEESYQRIKNDFSSIDAEKLKILYSKFRSDLEREAIVQDFIPLLAEKTLRAYLHKTEP